MDRLIVRRGLDACYYRFLEMFAVHRNVEVTLDRRQADRRRQWLAVEQDRRRQERRGEPPETWNCADFVQMKDEGR